MKSQPVAMTLYPFVDGSGANESYQKTEEASQQIPQPAEEDEFFAWTGRRVTKACPLGSIMNGFKCLMMGGIVPR
jgi:hypothetical protein